jgi:putative ABC transport system substrate-binding protein
VKRAKWQLVTLLAVLLAASLATRGLAAQQASGLPRVGFLYLGSPEQAGDAIHEGMRSPGWFDGSNISLENRFANNDPARLFVDAVDLAAAKVDVIVAFGPLPTQAARQATSTIPIVGATVDLGLVKSLARPGDNVTGVTLMMPDAQGESPGIPWYSAVSGISSPTVSSWSCAPEARFMVCQVPSARR